MLKQPATRQPISDLNGRYNTIWWCYISTISHFLLKKENTHFPRESWCYFETYLYFYVVFQEATLETYFPSWDVIEKHREVVKFVCGLMPDPRPLVDHVYTALIEHQKEEMRSPDGTPYIYRDLLESLYQESAVPLPGSALHNKHINYYDHEEDDRVRRPRDTTPVFTPCKLYLFEWDEGRCDTWTQDNWNRSPHIVQIQVNQYQTALTIRDVLFGYMRQMSHSQRDCCLCVEQFLQLNRSLIYT